MLVDTFEKMKVVKNSITTLLCVGMTLKLNRFEISPVLKKAMARSANKCCLNEETERTTFF